MPPHICQKLNQTANAQMSVVADIKQKEAMAEEIKSKAVEFDGAIKAVESDGERRITFVASSNHTDRHHEQVDVKTLRLPLKGGGFITAGAISPEGIEGVDVPLMLNHSADVSDVIGSVRKAYFTNGELVFEAGISSLDKAQEILTLIEEGHLSNAFSITMIDFDYEDATIYNAEVIEVSVVYRGSNKEARLLAVKSVEDAEAEEAEEQAPESEKTAEEPAEAVAEKDAPIEEPEQAEEAEAIAEAEEVVESTEPKAEEAEAETTSEESTNNEETTQMNDEIAKEAIVTPAVEKAVSGDYLKSKQALIDFKNIVLKFHRGSNEQIIKAWEENLKSKAVAGDAFLPTRIEQIMFKTWIDNPGILGTFRQLGVRAGAVYAMVASANGTAKGHAKGAEKVEQTVEAIRRDIKALCIYKKLSIDLQDLFDDETGELLAFRVEELAGRVANAIAVGAIIGAGSSNSEYLKSGRGLYPMTADINETDDDNFGYHVATKIANVTTDTILDKAIKTLGAVKGESKVLIVPEGFRTAVALLKNAQGFYLVGDAESFLNATIFEMPELTGSGFDMIAYARGSYVLAGEASASVRTDFDLTHNQDVMLVERYVAGSATGYKTVAGYASAVSA